MSIEDKITYNYDFLGLARCLQLAHSNMIVVEGLSGCIFVKLKDGFSISNLFTYSNYNDILAFITLQFVKLLLSIGIVSLIIDSS